MSYPIIVVAGPTASGKSGLALAIAEAFNGAIVNADSMQIYRELRIVTARPSAADEARVAHYLYGILPARQRCSAGRWAAMAAAEIARCRGADRVPVVVGGTGFYLKALMEGLSAIPAVPEEVRAEAMARHAEVGADAFHNELARIDPKAGDRIKPSDTQRATRAYEVWLATGQTLSEWQAEPPVPPVPGARFFSIVLEPARDALYAACDARFEAMMQAGALDEVRALAALGLDPGLPAMKALGVPELLRHLAGESSLENAVAAAKLATRQFAKRQATWFRTQIEPSERVFAQFSEIESGKIFSKIRDFMLTT